MLLNFSEKDINRSLAYNAHRAISFTPEKRADEVIKGYLAEMEALVTEFSQYATPENEARLRADLEAYRVGYIKRLHAKLAADSRCMSSMIVGPAKFPVAKNQKRLDTADKRSREWLDWCKRFKERLDKAYNPRRLANAPISADDPGAIDKLQAKVKEAERLQSLMKAANQVIRKKLTDAEKVKALIDLGVNETNAHELLKPDFAGRRGFPSFQLTNNLANIKRMKERIAQLEKEDNREFLPDREVNGVTISENRHINRIQLFFLSKPSEEIRSILKANGFRWAPSEGAWQRQLNQAGRQAAEKVLGVIFPPVTEQEQEDSQENSVFELDQISIEVGGIYAQIGGSVKVSSIAILVDFVVIDTQERITEVHVKGYDLDNPYIAKPVIETLWQKQVNPPVIKEILWFPDYLRKY